MAKRTEADIREGLSAFFGGASATMLAAVKSVDKNECTCVLDDEGLEYFEVRLRPIVGNNSGLVAYPKIGALALAVKIEDTDEWMIIEAAEYDSIELKVEKLEINGGTLGGLVKVNELTEKLNAFVQKYNTHTHIVNTTGTAAAQSGTTQATTGTATNFNKDDYEDDKIKH